MKKLESGNFVEARSLQPGEMFLGSFLSREEFPIEGQEKPAVKLIFGVTVGRQALWAPAMVARHKFESGGVYLLDHGGKGRTSKGRPVNLVDVYLLDADDLASVTGLYDDGGNIRDVKACRAKLGIGANAK